MKSFVSSLLIFALLLGGMILNYHYINDTCDTLAARIDALPPCGEAEDAIAALGAFWEAHKGKIELSVSGSDIEYFEESLAELTVANQEKEEADFATAKALLLEGVKRLRRLEQLDFVHLL